MQIRRFRAFEMSEALRAVKEELGPHAVILSTREIRQKTGAGPSSRPVVEVTAAVDPPTPGREKTDDGREDFPRVLKEAAANPPPVGDTDRIHEEIRAIRASMDSLRAEPRGPEQMAPPIQESLSEMKAMLRVLTEHSYRRQYGEEMTGMHQTLIALYDRLIASGFDREAARGIFRLMKQKLKAEDLWKEDFVVSYLKQLVKALVQVSGPVQPEGPNQKVVALIGPTGVGKTTTVAKIAAHQLRAKVPITLATLDTYRIGAVEQLKVYGRRLGLAVEVIASGVELQQVIARRRREKGMILIDTVGHSHLNDQGMQQLRFLEKGGTSIEKHLVLAANTKDSDLNDIFDRFSLVQIDRLLFTKIDETRTYGPLFSIMAKTQRPLSYLTTGQRVPEDIETATPKRIADLVLN